MAVSPRHFRAAARGHSASVGNVGPSVPVARVEPPILKYRITDPHHQADLKGEFGGATVFVEGGQQYVRLLETQAKFYVDSGGLELVSPPPAEGGGQ